MWPTLQIKPQAVVEGFTHLGYPESLALLIFVFGSARQFPIVQNIGGKKHRQGRIPRFDPRVSFAVQLFQLLPAGRAAGKKDIGFGLVCPPITVSLDLELADSWKAKKI